MDEWLEIRRRVLIEGVSKRHILRETGMHWQTLNGILANSSPPGYQRKVPVEKLKIGPFLGRIAQILKADKELPRNQRHTAKTIWRELEKEGFTGRYTIVKDAVRALKTMCQEVFMPLAHRPGEAQVDFGHALVRMAGILRKVAFFVLALPHSDAFFVMAFERECTETFWEGHVRAFEFFGGIAWGATYDNTKVCISKIVGPRARELTEGFKQLLSHCLFDPHFCLVRRANEKGVVEGVVKFARLNFFVPVPQVRDLEELNAYLLTMCRDDLARRLWGKKQTKAQLLEEDRVAFRLLPATPFEACRTVSTIADSRSLVRFNCNDYSVPVEYAHQGRRARFFTVSGLVTVLLEAREERQLERMLKNLQRQDLLVLDELGYVPFSKAGAELLFEVVSRAYERQSLIVTTNLPFENWPEVCGSERLTGAMLDRLTHRVHILEANGESYRLKQSRRQLKRQAKTKPPASVQLSEGE